MDDNRSSDSCTSFDGPISDLSSFAYTLFASLVTSTQETNVLISPFSIASALALVLAGATVDSLCQTQIASTLGVRSHLDVPAISKLLLSSSPPESSGVQIATANGIWTKDTIKASYQDIVKKEHSAIADVMPETYGPINQFVSEETGGMIKDLMTGSLDPLTVAIIVNAVFFKGSWKNKFEEEKTVQGTFHALQPNSKTIMPRKAMMMKSTRKTYFGLDVKELGGGHCALLEYGNADESGDGEESSFGAFFFLPEKNTHQSMQSMISSLTSFMTTSDKKNKRQMKESVKPLHHLMDNILLESKVALTIPRFKVSYGIKSLKSELQSLGITEAFNNNGKGMFDEMTNDPLVYLDEVYHKAVMEVNEEGTVAAASTAAVMMTRSIPRPPPELVFDRPFLMLVVHLETGLPLFMSKVDDPELL